MLNRSFIFFACVVLLACNNKKLEYKAYLKYLADEKNGLVKEKSVNGLKLKVKYLPADYLVYNTIKESDKVISEKDIDSVKKLYNNSLTFVLNLGPGEGETFSITKVGVENYEQFAQRIETMSFNMKEFVTLEINGEQYKPELTQMETINTLEPSKNIIVVFNSNQIKNSEELVFTYNDELFYTGVNKFKFKIKDFKNVPGLIMN